MKTLLLSKTKHIHSHRRHRHQHGGHWFLYLPIRICFNHLLNILCKSSIFSVERKQWLNVHIESDYMTITRFLTRSFVFCWVLFYNLSDITGLFGLKVWLNTEASFGLFTCAQGWIQPSAISEIRINIKWCSYTGTVN